MIDYPRGKFGDFYSNHFGFIVWTWETNTHSITDAAKHSTPVNNNNNISVMANPSTRKFHKVTVYSNYVNTKSTRWRPVAVVAAAAVSEQHSSGAIVYTNWTSGWHRRPTESDLTEHRVESQNSGVPDKVDAAHCNVTHAYLLLCTIVWPHQPMLQLTACHICTAINHWHFKSIHLYPKVLAAISQLQLWMSHSWWRSTTTALSFLFLTLSAIHILSQWK